MENIWLPVKQAGRYDTFEVCLSAKPVSEEERNKFPSKETQ